MGSLFIRKANIEDCEIIADLSSALNQTQGMTEYHRPDVNSLKKNFDWVDVYIAEYDSKPVGFIAGFQHFNPHNSYFRYVVSSIFVNDDMRRKGIGKSLLETLIKEKQKDNIQQFAIDVIPSSEAACHLYESLGFKKKEIEFINYRLGFGDLESFYKRAA